MNLWETFLLSRRNEESVGFSLHFDPGIEAGLRAETLCLAKYLRTRYCFPIHLHIYIKNREMILLRNGNRAYGNFRWFPKRTPYISIASKVEEGLLGQYSRDELYQQILSSLIHELTHYFQWALGLEQSSAVSERQANYYRYRILEEAEAFRR
jgi:hypothetical protein